MLKLLMRLIKTVLIGYMCISLIVVIPQTSYSKSGREIKHTAPSCAIAGQPIRIAADILTTSPPTEVRVYFKKNEMTSWYFVRMTSRDGKFYIGMLPPPKKTVTAVEYLILAVDSEGRSVKTPSLALPILQDSECPAALAESSSQKIAVFAEQIILKEIGFSGENVRWEVSEYSGKPYLNAGEESALTSPVQTAPDVQKAEKAESKAGKTRQSGSLLTSKTILIGAGVGALGVLGAMAFMKQEEKSPWTIPVDKGADDLEVTLNKSPQVQTTCGTMVTNQLFLTNHWAEEITVRTIDYEIVLTRDKPRDSCEAGRIGTFAPDFAIAVRPEETVLIREWSNEVNPCSGCPYLSTQCQWKSLYIVHTSVGVATAESVFSAEGDLCGASGAKSLNPGIPTSGDFEP